MNETYRGFRLLAPGTRHANKSWLIRGQMNGRQIEASSKTADRSRAEAIVDRMIERASHIKVDSPYRLADDTLPRWASRLLTAARQRTKASGLPFTLTPAEMVAIIKRANGFCEVTGIPFSAVPVPRSSRRPYIPSLDRINAAGGYVFDNCRLVTFAANMAMSDWGHDVLHRLTGGVGRIVGETLAK